MRKNGNSRAKAFLDSIPQISLDSETDDLTKRCKFNFSYFDNNQAVGQDFVDLSVEELCILLHKLKEYSRESLDHWCRAPVGRKSGHILELYDSFPRKSGFDLPSHVPHQARWGRFRLDYKGRLAGFVVPENYHDRAHAVTGFRFDRNTFYVVFLDKNHCFCP